MEKYYTFTFDESYKYQNIPKTKPIHIDLLINELPCNKKKGNYNHFHVLQLPLLVALTIMFFLYSYRCQLSRRVGTIPRGLPLF